MPQHERYLLVQLRSRTMPLHIETMLWQGKPLEERICLFCKRRTVEDEFLLCVCVNVKPTMPCEKKLFRSINACHSGLKI